MTANLAQPEPLVNASRATLSHYPALEKQTEAAINVLWYVEPLFNSRTEPNRREREFCALYAVSSIPYWQRTNACICISCLKYMSEGSTFMYYCLRAAVLLFTGKASNKYPHDATRSLKPDDQT